MYEFCLYKYFDYYYILLVWYRMLIGENFMGK